MTAPEQPPGGDWGYPGLLITDKGGHRAGDAAPSKGWHLSNDNSAFPTRRSAQEAAKSSASPRQSKRQLPSQLDLAPLQFAKRDATILEAVSRRAET